MVQRAQVLALVVVGVSLMACEEKAAEPTKAVATAQAPEPTATASAAPKADEAPKGVRIEEGTVLGLPTEKSKAPTDAEWAEAKDLEGVPGNVGPTACEVRLVREWLRVTCKAFGGDDPKKPKFKPETAEIVSGKNPETTAAVKANLGTLVVPLREGVDLSALIAYSAGGPKKAVTVGWPKGTDGPTLSTRTGM